ncbi:MAG: glycosyltransferase [Candidatus Lutacidiplasmatales archaeon]
MAGGVQVSFCATNLNTMARLPASVSSVDAIGRELTVPYEIVVADGPSHDGARAWLEARARTDERFRVVPHSQANRGYGRRKAFESSSGLTVVPFDTSLEYAPSYATLLRSYLGLKTDRMLFSEICALSRPSIDAVGGWRDLVGGEDIDLYGRVISRFGVIAWPTAERSSQAVRMSSFDRQMRYVGGSTVRRIRRIYSVQRDQIIGANFRVRDLMLFNRSKTMGRRAVLRLFFALAYAGSRWRPIKPFDLGRSNYAIFREAILESIRQKGYRALGWDHPSPVLLLTPDEVSFLRAALPRWTEYEAAAPPIIGIK